jgi:hypothetical protein
MLMATSMYSSRSDLAKGQRPVRNSEGPPCRTCARHPAVHPSGTLADDELWHVAEVARAVGVGPHGRHGCCPGLMLPFGHELRGCDPCQNVPGRGKIVEIEAKFLGPSLYSSPFPSHTMRI